MEQEKVYLKLDTLGIKYEKRNHAPVYTLQEFEEVVSDLSGVHCKNLFLRNKKGDKHYLVICSGSKKIDINELTFKLNSDRLSFASTERLAKYLGLTPGSVSPFGVINDESNEVTVIIDSALKEHDKVNFHPNDNTATISILYEDLLRFVKDCGNKVVEINV